MNIVPVIKSIGSSVLVLACILSTPVNAAEYYKWVGDDGVVHYGASPPKGVEAELVKTFGGVGVTKPSQETSDPGTAAGSATGSTAQLTPEQIEARNKRCTEERERLAVLTKPGRIRMSQEDGSVKYLSEEDIAREIEITEKVIADSCS